MPISGIHWTSNPRKWPTPSSHLGQRQALPHLNNAARNKVNGTTLLSRNSPLKKTPTKFPISVSAELVRDEHPPIVLGKRSNKELMPNLTNFYRRDDENIPGVQHSASTWSRPLVCIPKPTEPTFSRIRRRDAETLTIDATRCYFPSLSRTEIAKEKFTENLSSKNSQNQNNEVATLSSRRLENYSSVSFSSSSQSSFDEENASQHSEENRPSSKLVVRGQTIFNAEQEQKLVQTVEPTTTKSNRSCSTEDYLRPMITISKNKARLQNDFLEPKTERSVPIQRLSTNELGKVGFVRIDHQTYRISNNNNKKHSFSKNNNDELLSDYEELNEENRFDHDESLPPAHCEESYARFPRTSSTDQLENSIQQNLRSIVNQYIRPMANSINQSQLNKNQIQRFKRNLNPTEQNTLKIEDIRDKLLSSVDCAIYQQFQRCF